MSTSATTPQAVSANRVRISHEDRRAREILAQWFAVGGGVVMVIGIVAGILEPALWTPYGAICLGVGLVCAGAGLAARFTPKMFILVRRELAAYFLSPIAYMVLLGITTVAAFAFWWLVEEMGDPSLSFQQQQEPVIQYMGLNILLLFCLMVVVPVSTMRLLSEERRSGTIESLLSAPVTEAEVVLGKFLGCLIFYMSAWVPWGLFLGVLYFVGDVEFDPWPVLSVYIGLLTLGCTFVAGGLLFSSLTRNQIIAAILSFAMMMGLLVLIIVQGQVQAWGPDYQDYVEPMRYLSFWWQMRDFGLGKLDLRYVALHLTTAGFLLFVTVKVLESRKWR
jgi:ABC-2 type transport system permease protein